MFFFFLEFALTEGWNGTIIAIIQSVIKPPHKASAIGGYMFATQITGTIGTLVTGHLLGHFEGKMDNYIGKILALNTVLPCLVSAICFFMAAPHYAKYLAH